MKIGVSYGTATLMGFNHSKCDCFPTTAYLIIGKKCNNSCAFCSRGSGQAETKLSRISWPEYESDEISDKIAELYKENKLKRVCFQTVCEKDTVNNLKELIKEIKSKSPIQVSCSIGTISINDLKEIFDSGADRISIPMDCVSESLFEKIKKKSFKRHLEFLEKAGETFKGKITTHVIVGLGEKKEEVFDFLLKMKKCNIEVGLFAFTPIPHSEMAHCKSPDRKAYREIQLVHWLIKKEYGDVLELKEGNISQIKNKIYDILEKTNDKTDIFMTTGCKGCNRPYYNERPGQIPYNYPYKPTEEEIQKAIEEAFS